MATMAAFTHLRGTGFLRGLVYVVVLRTSSGLSMLSSCAPPPAGAAMSAKGVTWKALREDGVADLALVSNTGGEAETIGSAAETGIE